MAIAKKIQASIEGSSLIRRMFEEGEKRKKQYGAENVFDFSLGNPVFEPPPEVHQALLEILNSEQKGLHRYMPNAGLPETRGFLAEQLQAQSPLGFEVEDLVMTVGAGGALNVIFKSLLDPGDEVICLAPYFVEYDFYVENHGGVPVSVPTDLGFKPDLERIAQAITPKTKAVVINSPNNPTGVVYSADELKALGDLLRERSQALGHPISLVSDEPYRGISYDGVVVANPFDAYEATILATSSSKDLALPGERIGYLAISPQHPDRELLRQATVLALRTLGFVNAPALMQRMLPLVGQARVDLAPYRANREMLLQHLNALGFECVRPEGAFYLFPKSLIEDDLKFVAQAQELNLLLVPGSAFKGPGHFRIAYCFDPDMVRRSLPKFTELAQAFGYGPES